MVPEERTPAGDDATRGPMRSSDHVLHAIEGSTESLSWIVSRFSPLLLAQADYRLGESLRRHADPEDVVEDVWAATLPRLRELRPVPDRAAATMMRYLSTAVLRRIQQIAEKHAPRKGTGEQGDLARHEGAAPVTSLADSSSTPASKAARREARSEVRNIIETLDADDRDVVVLRAIEQWSIEETAAELGISPNAAAVRYHRAINRLRTRIPDSLISDLAD